MSRLLNMRAYRLEIAAIGGLIVFNIALFVPLLLIAITSRHTDYWIYTVDAETYITTGERVLTAPHFLFTWATAALSALLPGVVIPIIVTIIGVASYASAGIIMFLLMRQMLPRPVTVHSTILCVISSLALLVITPITIFTPDTPHTMYFGYLPVSVHHSPTLNMMKPASILLFYFAFRAFERGSTRSSWRMIAATAALTIMSPFIKPNFVLSLVPAVVVFSFVMWIRKQSFDWRLLLIGIVIPAIAVLGLQLLSYTGSNGTIVFKPLAYMAFYGDTIPSLFVKFFLSILFPLVIYLFYWQHIKNNKMINLAWVIFGFGAIQAYFFAETGIQEAAGNFMWGVIMSQTILFSVSLWWFVSRTLRIFTGEQTADRRFLITILIFGLHLVSGVIWYSQYLQRAYF